MNPSPPGPGEEDGADSPDTQDSLSYFEDSLREIPNDTIHHDDDADDADDTDD